MQEGVTQLPDRVLDDVLDQLPATRQRRAGLLAGMVPVLNGNALRVGIAAVVLGAAAFLGVRFLPGGGGVGGPLSSAPAGLLPEGSHVVWEGGYATGVSVTVVIPAAEWYGEAGGGTLTKHNNAYAPDGAGMFVFPGDGEMAVYGDPCDWFMSRPVLPQRTVDEFVTAISAQASRAASSPIDVTLDGYAGKSLILHVPDDAVFSECHLGMFASWGLRGADKNHYRFHQSPGQTDKLWILDVNGELVVIDIGYYDGTPQEVIDELEAIVESTTFE
jgi:hypothetical protein